MHYGRALVGLEAELREYYPGVLNNKARHVRTMELYDELSIALRPCVGRPLAQATSLTQEFYKAVFLTTEIKGQELRPITRLVSELMPLRYADGGNTTVRYTSDTNYTTDESFAVFIDLTTPGKNLFDFYAVLDKRYSQPIIAAPVEAAETETIKLQPIRSRIAANRTCSHSVNINLNDFGFVKPREIPLRNIEQGSMSIRLSEGGSYFMTLPTELLDLYEPMITARINRQHIRVGPHNIKLHWEHGVSDTDTLNKKRIFVRAPDENNVVPQYFFNISELSPTGPIAVIGERLLEVREMDTMYTDTPYVKAKFKAYINFLQWIENPTYIKDNALTGEFLHVTTDDELVPEDARLNDAPFCLHTSEERLNYLLERGRNMDSGSRWMRGATVAPSVDYSIDSGTCIRSPKMSQYDTYALFRALKELELIDIRYRLTDKQRAEYVVRRWLPWHTIANIKNYLPETLVRYIAVDKTTLKRGDVKAFNSFLKKHEKLFGEVIGTAIPLHV